MFINVQLMAINVLKNRAKRLNPYRAQECKKTNAKRNVKINLCKSSITKER